MLIHSAGLKIIILLPIKKLFSSQIKFQNIIEEKITQLVEWTHKRSVLVFDGDKFRSFVKAVPKNYSAIVQFTALNAKRQCSICR